jgi:copper homeostasis protein (lipoprotein)
MKLLHSVATIAFAVTCFAPIVSAQDPIVTGTISYRERIALPATAVIEITLEDVSRPGAVSEVVARAEVSGPRQPPLPFALEYDPASITGSHRYAVRARILDAGRVLFTTAQAPLVLTQGHGDTVRLMLTMVSSPAMEPTSPGASASVKPLESGSLPATFSGTFPCADCRGLKYELSLFADDSFVLRTTRLGTKPVMATDAIGSWVRASDGQLVMLETSAGARHLFSVVDGRTLRLAGQDDSVGGKPKDLRRATQAASLGIGMPMTGIYRVVDGHGEFAECSTGQRWAVAPGPDATTLTAALHKVKTRAGNGIFASIEGSVTPGGSTPLAVTRLASTDPIKSCAPRFVSMPLSNTSWRLTALGAAPVPKQTGRAGDIGLNFREETGSFGGNGGCNRLAGAYQIDGASLTLRSFGTLRACPDATDREALFRAALNDTRSYRILGRTLELFNADSKSVAKFESVQ